MENLVISIGADTKEFVTGITEVGEKTKNLGESLKNVGLVAGAAFTGYTASIMASVYAYREQEKVGQEVEAIIQSTGGIAGMTSEAIQDLAESLSKSTTFSKLQVERGEEVLLTFDRIGKDTFPAATRAVLDLAQRMGGDTSSAAQTLGRALQDPMNGMQMLRRAGILFTDQQKHQIETMELSGNIAGAQAIILKQVESQYGGMAKAAAGGVGSIAQLKNTMEELSVGVGQQFAPMVQMGAAELNKLLLTASKSEGFKTLTAGILSTGAAVSGFITTAVAGATAVNALGKATETAKLVMQAFGITVRGVVGATGIGLLLIVASEIYLHWNQIWPAMQATFQAFVKHTGDAAKALAELLMGAFTLNVASIRQGIADAAKAYAEGMAEVNKVRTPVATPDLKAAAEKAGKELAMAEALAQRRALQSEQDATRKLEAQSMKVAQEAEIMELQGQSKEIVSLKRNEAQLLKKIAEAKNDDEKAALREGLAQVRQDYADKIQWEKNFEKDYLTNNKSFQKLDASDQAAFRKQQGMALSQSLMDEDEAKVAALQKELETQVTLHNQMLVDEQQFGSAYARINRIMHDSIVQGSKTAFGDLEQMTQSHNSTLKAIGKAAAVANITIKTAESAENVYAGFATIPIIGPALGIAAAAAAVAFGVEKVHDVLAANQGGLVTGGVPGIDSVPALLTPGELVVPKQNYEEVVTAVSNTRAGQMPYVNQPAQPQTVVIQFKGDASKMLQAMSVRDKGLGTYRGT